MLYEHWGDNRSGKSALNAFFAWLAYLQGKTVYCNCPQHPLTGIYDCILNFSHQHLTPAQVFREEELFDCYIMTDQGETAGLDSFNATTREAKEAVYFGLQATKQDVDWHFDTVRHKSILNRLRMNVHFYIQTIRYPQHPKLPLVAMKVRIKNRYSAIPKRLTVMKPNVLFPLFNSHVLVRPISKAHIDRPSLEQLHKQLVGP